jgi:HEAT repeat protein
VSRNVTGSALQPARLAIRRAVMRRHLRSVAAGRTMVLNLELGDKEIDSAALLVAEAAPLEADHADFKRLVSSMKTSGLADAVVDGLSSRDPVLRTRSLRVAGAMRMESLVMWIGPLLWSREPSVRSAAARTLGRIGGWRAADALLIAIQRLGPRPVLVIALARAAPDLYLEAILRSPQRRSVHPAVALAAGLRRRRTATFVLMGQMAGGSRRMRVACCRALGWIGAPVGTQALCTALADRDWHVRTAAAKALGSISTYEPGPLLEVCLTDRNPRMQRAARDAIRRLTRPVSAEVGET